MAGKAKEVKVSADELKKVYDAVQHTDEFDWNGSHVIVKKNIGITDMIQFVHDVSSTCFSTNDGEYLPEVFDFVVRCATLDRYTNIELPEEIEDKCSVLYGTDIYMMVISHVDSVQYNVLLEAARKKVDYVAQSNIEALTKQINDIDAKFDEIADQLNKLFENVDGDSLNDALKAISNGDFNVNDIVNAVMANRNSAVI